MKFLLTLFIASFGLTLTAQVTSGRTEYDKQTFESLQLTIDADYETVADKWEDFWEERYDIDFDKLDKDRGSKAFKAEQAVLPLVSTKNADLYSKVSGGDETARVSLAIAFTANDIVTRRKHEKSYEAAEAIMNEFRTWFYNDYFEDRLKDARDELADMRDDSTDDSKDAQKARKKIDKYEKKIEDYNKKISDLREEVGEELQSAEEKAARAKELEQRVRDLERRRAKYLG